MAGIVVGIDGSTDAQAALRWALDEAGRRGVPAIVLLAWEPDSCPGVVADRAAAPGVPGLEAAACAVLREAVRRSCSPRRRVTVLEQPVYADAVDALVTASTGADMLVVGQHGASVTRRLVMGSVSSACVRRAAVPVVVVRSEPRIVSDGPVLVGVDGSAASVTALRWAASEAKVRQVPLRVMHVHASVPSVRVPHVAVDTEPARKAAHRILDECLHRGIPGTTDAAGVQTLIRLGRPAASLIAASADASLLVLGARGRGGFRRLRPDSTTHRCLHHASAPVVVVPASR